MGLTSGIFYKRFFSMKPFSSALMMMGLGMTFTINFMVLETVSSWLYILKGISKFWIASLNYITTCKLTSFLFRRTSKERISGWRSPNCTTLSDDSAYKKRSSGRLMIYRCLSNCLTLIFFYISMVSDWMGLPFKLKTLYSYLFDILRVEWCSFRLLGE